MSLKNAEPVETVYAVVTDDLLSCVVRTLWSNEEDAQKYAEENGGRVVAWAVLRFKEGKEEDDL